MESGALDARDLGKKVGTIPRDRYGSESPPLYRPSKKPKPASLVPPGSPIYLEIPEGSKRRIRFIDDENKGCMFLNPFDETSGPIVDPFWSQKLEVIYTGFGEDPFDCPELPSWMRRPEIEVTKEQMLSQTKEFAEAALKHHYRNKQKKYVLVKPLRDTFFYEGPGRPFVHVNFTAKQMDQADSEAVPFFAEITLRPGVCDPEDMWISTCCCILKGESLGGCISESMVGPNNLGERRFPMDLKRCYACSEKMEHPTEEQYDAGHVARKFYYVDDL